MNVNKESVLPGSVLKPCPLVRDFSEKIAAAAMGKPILDVACGSGRNAVPLCLLGCTVICIDKDLTFLETELRRHPLRRISKKFTLRTIDLLEEAWPFAPRSVGGIINVHFLAPELLSCFAQSLSPGGYLLLETVPGCGGNYLQLPKAGALRAALSADFNLELYKEHSVGPQGQDAVTVKLLGRRRT